MPIPEAPELIALYIDVLHPMELLNEPDRRYSAEYLLIALAERPNCVAANLLRDCGFDPQEARKEVHKKQVERPPEEGVWNGYDGVEASHVYDTAHKIAGSLQSDCVSTEHLLLALLHRHKCGAYSLIGKLGINRNRLQSVLVKLLRAAPPAETANGHRIMPHEPRD